MQNSKCLLKFAAAYTNTWLKKESSALIRGIKSAGKKAHVGHMLAQAMQRPRNDAKHLIS